MTNDTPEDADLLDTSGPTPDPFESMGLVKPDLASLSIRTHSSGSSGGSGADRELLERAAKAAGVELDGKFSTTDRMSVARGGWWNPLIDDGDALRLVSKLKLHIGMESNVANAWARDDFGNFQTVILRHFGDDAALRRAIVKAAAHMALTPTGEAAP